MGGYEAFLISVAALVVIHELAHAAATLLVRLPLREIHLGRASGGRALATVGGAKIYVGFGMSGRTRHAYAGVSHLLLRRRVIILAGPLVNLAFAPLAFLATGSLQVFGVAALLLAVENLIPLSFRGHISDGMQLARSRADVDRWQSDVRSRR